MECDCGRSTSECSGCVACDVYDDYRNEKCCAQNSERANDGACADRDARAGRTRCANGKRLALTGRARFWPSLGSPECRLKRLVYDWRSQRLDEICCRGGTDRSSRQRLSTHRLSAGSDVFTMLGLHARSNSEFFIDLANAMSEFGVHRQRRGPTCTRARVSAAYSPVNVQQRNIA